MIHARIRLLSDLAMEVCCNDKCRKLPQYVVHYPRTSLWDGDRWFIKPGTLVGELSNDVYCRDCIDQVYQHIKSKLDSKLWVFE